MLIALIGDPYCRLEFHLSKLYLCKFKSILYDTYKVPLNPNIIMVKLQNEFIQQALISE